MSLKLITKKAPQALQLPCPSFAWHLLHKTHKLIGGCVYTHTKASPHSPTRYKLRQQGRKSIQGVNIAAHPRCLPSKLTLPGVRKPSVLTLSVHPQWSPSELTRTGVRKPLVLTLGAHPQCSSSWSPSVLTLRAHPYGCEEKLSSVSFAPPFRHPLPRQKNLSRPPRYHSPRYCNIAEWE